MPPFVLPEFYRPYPARLNPNVESARVHSKEWATEHGMVGTALGRSGQPVWTEGKFDAMDFALLCGYAYPDAAPDTLGLLTDWTVWLFYVDDCLVDVYGRGGLAGVREFLAGLEPFMPGVAGAAAEPEGAVQTSLADLTARTSPLVSEEWSARHADGLRDSHSAAVQELINVADGVVPDPIEYIHMRRATAGGLLGADLVMLGTGTEISDALIDARPLRVLRESMADAFGLHNDIYSYGRELEEEGSLNNAVHVAQHFYGCSTQEAVDSVNDVLTSRLHQFEHTASTELPIFFAEMCVDAKQQADVHGYVRALREYEAGSHEAHLHSDRYDASGPHRSPTVEGALTGPNSLAVQAPRIVGSLGSRDAPPFRVPEMYTPWGHRINPALDTARAHSLEWARRMGLLDMPLAGGRTWEDNFRGADCSLYCAATLTDIPAEHLCWYSEWMAAFVLVDDVVVDWFIRPRNRSGAKEFVTRLQEFMSEDPKIALVPTSPIEHALVDLRTRASSLGMSKFASNITKGINDQTVEIDDNIFDRIPDPVAYIKWRRNMYGSITPALLASDGISSAGALPSDVLNARPVQLMFEAFVDVTWLTNDVYSYRMEMLDEGGLYNLVLVARRFGDGNLQRAVEAVSELRDARVRHFRRIGDTQLPALVEEFQLDSAGRAALFRLRDELAVYIAGDHYWYKQVGRYVPRSEVSPARRVLAGPQGLGTTAARPFSRRQRVPNSSTLTTARPFMS